ncbi:DNA-processing protein DprA [Microbacterium sp.]|uniref:DNA-processing protein DprA n=1 Tax=Microbacterium sp. TaxID=51671 RepID=UPI0039E6A7B9
MATITSLAKDERAARFVLAAALEPDDSVTGRLLAAVGAVETVRLAVSDDAMPRTVDPVEGALWRGKVAPRLDSRIIERARKETEQGRFDVLVPGDPYWPAGLSDLGHRAPAALWVSGAGSFLATKLCDSATITGMRAATGYGEYVAREIAADLAGAERVVVSGGGYGIDRAAHLAALEVDGPTIAVLSGGLNRLYPAGNRDLLERIGGLGLLVSELPPDATPTRWRILAHDRIMAALSGATVIVEAGYRSGSLNVAARAAQIGRPVGAVPGPVTSVASAGTHRLLRDGIASLVTQTDDLNRLLEGGNVPSRPSIESGVRPARPTPRVGPSL